jgi:hypothetical protein
MLNPESVVVRRSAGLRARRVSAGSLGAPGLTDEPLLYTGGGTTELVLDLLFDVSLAGSSIETDDVRQLTAPLWQLAENASGDTPEARVQPPLVTFVWGKTWNIPGLVAAVAERLEYFTPGGAPQRSWLRMRLLRVSRPQERAPAAPMTLPGTGEELLPDELPALLPAPGAPAPAEGADDLPTHEVIGDGGGGERLDQIAGREYGDASLWTLLAGFNGVEDPLHLSAGALLRIPPLSQLLGG